MKQKTVLFDLDGTLRRWTRDAFTKGYFYPLGSKTGPPWVRPGGAGG